MQDLAIVMVSVPVRMRGEIVLVIIREIDPVDGQVLIQETVLEIAATVRAINQVTAQEIAAGIARAIARDSRPDLLIRSALRQDWL